MSTATTGAISFNLSGLTNNGDWTHVIVSGGGPGNTLTINMSGSQYKISTASVKFDSAGVLEVNIVKLGSNYYIRGVGG